MIDVLLIQVENYLGIRSGVQLPDTGVVVVSGPNGAGKSALFVEAVSLAFWGKSIRKKLPAIGKKDAIVVMGRLGNRAVRAERGNGSLSVSREADIVFFQSASKGYAELEKIVGEHDAWRRSCVVSSDDLATFTRVADAERKRTLEAVLGLDVFDDALRRCREAKAEIEKTRGEHAYELGLLRDRLGNAKRNLKMARDRFDSIEVPDDNEATVAEIDVEIERVRSEISDLEGKRAALDMELGEIGDPPGEHPYAKRIDRIASGHCPTCEQEVSADRIEQIRREVSEAAKARKDHRELVSDLRNRLRKAESKARKLNGVLSGLLEDRSVAAAHDERKAAADREQKKAAAEIEKESNEVDAAHEKFVAADEEMKTILSDIDHHNVVERVLGTRGVRGPILSAAVEKLSIVANMWARRLGDIELEISPRRAKKSGKAGEVVEAITIRARHSRSGEKWIPFESLSSGQKRRVDVAVVFALSEVAHAVRGAGSERGTLFCDEVDVNLDEDGREALASVLEDVAKDRCVVVISPTGQISEYLNPALRLVVDGGNVRAL